MRIKRIHYLSGLTLSIFIGLHLCNHFISIFGIAKHIELMDILRKVYRNLFVESILLMAVATQIYSGIKLLFSKEKIAKTFFEKLHRQTGLYLAFFLLIHVGAVLTGRFLLKLDTNFYFGAAGLNTFPMNLFFIPYYGLAIIAFFGHLAAIHNQKMKKSIFGITPTQQAQFILVKGIIVTLVIFYGLTKGFTGVAIPEAYNILIGQ